MAITAQNITSHEFIGLDTRIVNSTNRQIIGLNGRIVNETKSMFTINNTRHKATPIAIPKAGNKWEFKIQGDTVIVDGSKIIKRPYDRVVGREGRRRRREDTREMGA